MIYFFKTPPFHIQREIFRTLSIGKVRLAERRVTQSRALPIRIQLTGVVVAQSASTQLFML